MALPELNKLSAGTQTLHLDGSHVTENDELLIYWKRKGFTGNSKISYQPSAKAFDFLVEAFTHLDLGEFFPDGGEELDGASLNQAIHQLIKDHGEPVEREMTLKEQVGNDGVTRLVPRIG
jgi:hypothetical protein